MIRKGVGLRIIMKQFSLEEYLKNPGRHIVTRKGTDAKIIYTDRSTKTYPVFALIQNEEYKNVLSYTNDGINVKGCESPFDLFFVTEKKEGWINIYKSESMAAPIGGRIYDSKEEAETEGKRDKIYIATVKIEWEEE